MTSVLTEALTTEEIVKIAREQVDAFGDADWERMRGMLASDSPLQRAGNPAEDRRPGEDH